MKKLSMSKKAVIFIIINCTFVELFIMALTIAQMVLCARDGTMVDFSPLTTIIPIVIGEVGSYGVYALKSMKENTKGGIVYETAMLNNDECGCDESEDESAVG